MTVAKGAVRFEKWEGLGNDFVVVEDAAMTAEVARGLCDRRRGVGADGVLVVRRRPARMEVWNADGSRPEMCGNGLRCVAAYLVAAYRAGHGAPGEAPRAVGDALELRVATDAGERRCEVTPAGEHGYEVTVDMGRARVGEPLSVTLDGKEHRFLGVDVGNPHAVTFEPYAEEIIDAIAPRIATAPPGGINVEFCRAEGARGQARRIAVTVWERGVGRTLACGTGACAVAAAACELGLSPFEAPLAVALPGGELTITVAAGTRALLMRGPARRVFTGEVVLA